MKKIKVANPMFFYVFNLIIFGSMLLCKHIVILIFPNVLIKDWLDKHAEYEAIVDGANIGLYQQNFADGGFSLSQVVHPKMIVALLFCQFLLLF